MVGSVLHSHPVSGFTIPSSWFCGRPFRGSTPNQVLGKLFKNWEASQTRRKSERNEIWFTCSTSILLGTKIVIPWKRWRKTSSNYVPGNTRQGIYLEVTCIAILWPPHSVGLSDIAMEAMSMSSSSSLRNRMIYLIKNSMVVNSLNSFAISLPESQYRKRTYNLWMVYRFTPTKIWKNVQPHSKTQ